MTVAEEICDLYNIPINLIMNESINKQLEEFKKQIENGIEIPQKLLNQLRQKHW